jgi:hypothetical protein
VYKFFRGATTSSARDCSDACRKDLNCYAFNHVKLTKWCYLGSTQKRNLKFVDNSKMASGFRQCSTHSTNAGWTSEIFTVAGVPTFLAASRKTDTSVYLSYVDGAVGNPVEKYSVKCVLFGASCTAVGIGTSLSYPRATAAIPVSGLSANTQYYCYVIATNSVGSMCSAALPVTSCAAGKE